MLFLCDKQAIILPCSIAIAPSCYKYQLPNGMEKIYTVFYELNINKISHMLVNSPIS